MFPNDIMVRIYMDIYAIFFECIGNKHFQCFLTSNEIEMEWCMGHMMIDLEYVNCKCAWFMIELMFENVLANSECVAHV